jgi:hypothetical protein
MLRPGAPASATPAAPPPISCRAATLSREQLNGQVDRVPASVPRREFRDRNGVLWSVREMIDLHEPWALGEGCLVFESAGAIRRVWRYPARWRELSDAELGALSWER